MGLVLKHVIVTKAGTLHYRRRFPKDAIPIIGRGEFKRLLGSTEREALRNYPKVNAEFERLVTEARRRVVGSSDDVATPLDIHRAAERRAAELAHEVVHIGGREVSASDPEAADIMRESYLSRLPADPETGDPIGGGAVEGRALGILSSGGRLSRPAPTVEDAKRLYVGERVKGDINERTKEQRVERISAHMKAAGMGGERLLTGLRREDARNVRDYMLRDLGMTPATARRYLNDIRAMIGFGMWAHDLPEDANPFLGVSIKEEIRAVEQRQPIPEDVLPAIRERIENHAGTDLWQTWRIMEGTGCRLGEVTGLLVSDLHLDHVIPHISLVFHPHRRLKNQSSIRKVPLVGEALEAAKEARKAAGDSPHLFARYGRPRGADAASAILMKHLRAVTDDPKIVNHSLRHTMEDRMTLARVDEFDRALVLGHNLPGMSGRYGSDVVRLEVAARAVKAAAGVARKARAKHK